MPAAIILNKEPAVLGVALRVWVDPARWAPHAGPCKWSTANQKAAVPQPPRLAGAVLKRSLYECFSQFGPVLDVVCMKTIKMRGQAFVVFKDVTAATNALRQMQGFSFFDREMNIQFAKGKSDAVAKLEGSWVPRDAAEKMKKRKADEERREKKRLEREAEKAAKVEAAAADEAAAMDVSSKPEPAAVEEEIVTEPNKVLFVQGLPSEFPPMALKMLFQQYPGLQDVSIPNVPGREGIAFVEFEDEMQATVAMNGLQGFKVTAEDHIRVSYRKK
eukprot:SAG11_NODE_812_length_7059_cov_5.203017_8_plen_274_part_00